MPSKGELRQVLQSRLDNTIGKVNIALQGKDLEVLEPVLARLGRGGTLPHWYNGLKRERVLPNLDGKTIGSVVEMILVAILETNTFAELKIPRLRINPARGVDLPDLDLGVKSPSTNFCTSEPFFSAYERLYGSDHDALILLTDYQEKKKSPPLRLQIVQWRYLYKSQIADENLCKIAAKHRKWLLKENEAWTRKMFRYLAFVNQSDWRAKWILRLVDSMREPKLVDNIIQHASADFDKQNKMKDSKDKPLIPPSDLHAINSLKKVKPLALGIIDAADNWVAEVLNDIGRLPNDNEWKRLLESPLDGRIGMSFALQWRYNFGRIFNGEPDEEED